MSVPETEIDHQVFSICLQRDWRSLGNGFRKKGRTPTSSILEGRQTVPLECFDDGLHRFAGYVHRLANGATVDTKQIEGEAQNPLDNASTEPLHCLIDALLGKLVREREVLAIW